MTYEYEYPAWFALVSTIQVHGMDQNRFHQDQKTSAQTEIFNEKTKKATKTKEHQDGASIHIRGGDYIRETKIP